MLEIDGSYGESGGQILRTAIALSAIKNTPVRIYNIRANRPEPGLKAQHLLSSLAAAKLCNAEIIGAKIGSKELIFKPKKIRFGKFKFDVGTAGSITLVLQTLVPIVAFANGPVELEITGGTDVTWSPPIDYFENIFCTYAEKFGLLIINETLKRGFYPKGGGLVKVKIFPIKNPKPLHLEKRGDFLEIKAFSVASRELERAKVAERQISTFKEAMSPNLKVREFVEYVESSSPGSVLYAHALFQIVNWALLHWEKKESLQKK
ncbi:MAG: RNA 3'-terminal phosphate cyclase [Candidatus Nanoarchaeia archaeon]